MDLFEVGCIVLDKSYANACKNIILLRLFSRCLKWLPKRKALPRRGRYLRDSRQNQLGWKNTSEEVQENNDVHGLQVV